MFETRKGGNPLSASLTRLGLAGRLLTTALLVALVAAISLGLLSTVRDRDRAAAEAAAAVAGPAALTPEGMVRFGSRDATTVMTVTEDMQCPLCRTFESVTGPTVASLVDQQRTAVDYNVVAIRDRSSTTEYSSRAANASACVAEADKSKWLAWRHTVLDHAPADGSAGLSDQQLIDAAVQAGIAPTAEFSGCVTDRRYRAFVASQTGKAIAAKLNQVPAVRIGDVPVTNLTPEGIEAGLRRAAAR